MLVGTRKGRFLRSDDAGEAWRDSSSGLDGAGYRVFTFVPNPFRPGRWYLGTCNGGFWRSDDGGLTCTKEGGITMPPSVNALLTDNRVQGRLYAGTSAGPVVSDDSGETWRPLGQGLEGIEVLSLAFGAPGGALFAGTWTAEVGVHRLEKWQ